LVTFAIQCEPTTMAASKSFAIQTVSTGLMQENASVEQEQDANIALTDLDKGISIF